MKVLVASSEVHPYAQTGGLADVAAALSKWLAKAGAEVALVTPLYRGIRERYPDLRRVDYHLDLPMGRHHVQAELYRRHLAPRLTLYFVHQPGFFDRPQLYQEHGVDYADNAARFIFFSKCVTHMARYLSPRPDVLHLHDWQAALVPLLVRHQKWRDRWNDAPHTCLTIHNLAYQGIFPSLDYELTNLPWDYWQPGAEFYGAFNCLKTGITHADILTTVSPRYSREILTESFGFGLDGVLRQREDDLYGILNGVDYEEWNTLTNPHLRHPYSQRNLRGKARQKADLQSDLGLPIRPRTPLFGNISRLVDQKGSDLILEALGQMLGQDLQFVQLGSGMPAFEDAFEDLARRHPDQIAVRIGYDIGLAHRIEAGCDFFLMPSRYEPCGLNQMYSMRYGTIPVVRATGGLDDSVIDVTEDPHAANGIEFREASVPAVVNAMQRALALYAEPAVLRRFRHHAMGADFSWETSAQEYLRLYRRVVGVEPHS